MQKISSYLYPNRISFVSNLASSPLEWRIVYQRKVKIYKGLDNVIELDIKNSEQKRIDITSYNMKFVIMDQLDQEIYQADVDVNTGSKGLATVTIPASPLQYLTPQFLKYSVYYITDAGAKMPIYGDTQFGVTGTIELLGGAMPESLPAQVIDTFTFLENDADPDNVVTEYFSEGAEINTPNDFSSDHAITVDFYPEGLSASVVVQVTDFTVISSTTEWTDLETFDVEPTDTLIRKVYASAENYSNNLSWIRIKYTPTEENTGKFDKVLVRL